MKLEQRIDEDLSSRFAKMGFLSAVCIVYLHTGCASDGEVVGGVLHHMIETFCRVAIPWFFYAAGFFLAGHIGENGWYKKEVFKRFKTLLVPFWIWSSIICIIWVLIAVVIRLIGYQYHGMNAFEWITPTGILRVLGIDPLHNVPTMWFLRTLFLLVCLSPIVYRGGGLFVLFSFLSYVAFKIWYYDMGRDVRYLMESLISLRGLTYFSLGIYVRVNRFKLNKSTCNILSIVGIIIFAATCFSSGMASRLFDVLMVPFMMIGMFVIVGHIRIPGLLTSNAFPLYLIHGIVAYCISAIYGLSGIKGCFVFGLLKWAVSILSSIIVSMTMRNLLPRFSKVAFGGR